MLILSQAVERPSIVSNSALVRIAQLLKIHSENTCLTKS
jgi:hypothetical protein